MIVPEVFRRGRTALLVGSQDAVFGVLASSRGDAPDALPETGMSIRNTP